MASSPQSRRAPEIELSAPPADYASLLVSNYDWWQETINCEVPPHLWDRMAKAKIEAIELDDRRKTPIDFDFGDEHMQIQPYGGKGGTEFIIENDDIRFAIGSPKRSWCVSFQCRSAALWEHGLQALRDRCYEALEREGCVLVDDDSKRLSRVDFAVDIWSEAFSAEMRPEIAYQVVSPSKCKTLAFFYCNETNLESLFIGRGSSCQIRVYDKTKEIRQASGKVWMYDLWGESGGYWPGDEPADVWRIELQVRSEWLKDRNCHRPGDFLLNQQELLSEALFQRRLAQPCGSDSNRRRWPLHPMFTMALAEVRGGREYLPIGYRVTGKSETLKQQALAQIAGTSRSLAVLASGGDFDEQQMNDLIDEARERVTSDQEHAAKIRRAQERYEFVDQAQ